MSTNTLATLLTSINTGIDTLKGAERVVKATINEVCPNILTYVWTGSSENPFETMDVRLVNRLLSVCTPMNKRSLTIFFKAMTPFAFNEEKGEFTKLDKKKVENAQKRYRLFLEEYGTDVWGWLKDNTKTDSVPKPFDTRLTTLVSQALSAEKDGLTPAGVIKAVLAAGITSDGVLEVLGALDEELYEEEVESVPVFTESSEVADQAVA